MIIDVDYVVKKARQNNYNVDVNVKNPRYTQGRFYVESQYMCL